MVSEGLKEQVESREQFCIEESQVPLLVHKFRDAGCEA